MVPGENPLLVLQMANLLTMSSRGRESVSFMSLLRGAPIPFLRALSSCPNGLPNASPPKTTTLGIRALACEIWGDTTMGKKQNQKHCLLVACKHCYVNICSLLRVFEISGTCIHPRKTEADATTGLGFHCGRLLRTIIVDGRCGWSLWMAAITNSGLSSLT